MEGNGKNGKQKQGHDTPEYIVTSPTSSINDPSKTFADKFAASRRSMQQFLQTTLSESATASSSETVASEQFKSVVRSSQHTFGASSNQQASVQQQRVMQQSISSASSRQLRSFSSQQSEESCEVETSSTTTSASSSSRKMNAPMHLSLTTSFLAPPDRRLTILSPHSPVHGPTTDLLGSLVARRKGRVPMLPRLAIPRSDSDLLL